MASLDGFARWIRHCNTADYHKYLLPFLCEGTPLGHCKPSFARQLAKFPTVFRVTEKDVSISEQLRTSEARTEAIADVLHQLQQEGVVTGWRDEQYPVSTGFMSEPFCLIERAAAVPFGIRSYGVHVNGFTRYNGGLQLWVARRARNKPTWPGKLDHICAGGQPHGISPAANVIKECAEEASIPDVLARKATPAGAVSYAQLQDLGLKRDCLFCYDLELPEDFRPHPGDAEVETFQLMDIEEVAKLIESTDDFKDNCNLVIIDFLIRHGVIKPENPGYLSLVAGLRQVDCA